MISPPRSEYNVPKLSATECGMVADTLLPTLAALAEVYRIHRLDGGRASSIATRTQEEGQSGRSQPRVLAITHSRGGRPSITSCKKAKTLPK